eukprot:6484516-Amphidinium_carterae.1
MQGVDTDVQEAVQKLRARFAVSNAKETIAIFLRFGANVQLLTLMLPGDDGDDDVSDAFDKDCAMMTTRGCRL